MDEDIKRLKLDCIAIASQYCRKYDADGRMINLSSDEIVAHAATYFKFINEENPNV